VKRRGRDAGAPSRHVPARARTRRPREPKPNGEPAAANPALDELLAALVHDLRNPLNIVVTWTHLLQRNALDAEGAAKALASIREQTELSAKILADVVEYAQLASGTVEIGRAPLDLGALAKGAVDTLRPLARERFVRLEVTSGGPLPVAGDATRLERVARAMVARAVEATKAPGRVRVAWDARDGEARFEVAADGGGFSAEDGARLFAPVGPSDRVRGTGNLHLELAIAELVARRHGGRLEATSPGPDAGATYTFTLPLA
jgi:signal transduction histidine kinase